ncbi:hypothetical protein [Corynebacterium confusum]|uniref:hypothetical protein n=1 Tax=Corynebacterium confusum TaxID=71254 RepID=UPI0025B539A5|nr:hypothetical protein [Corynebacterium confusum]WJY90519.1 hypothetical protein CCONF_10120 [Corynebacterium confusum]
MDISTIITHLDNFVDTWEGWSKVLNNSTEALANVLGTIVFLGDNPTSSDFAPAMSSLSSN